MQFPSLAALSERASAQEGELKTWKKKCLGSIGGMLPELFQKLPKNTSNFTDKRLIIDCEKKKNAILS